MKIWIKIEAILNAMLISISQFLASLFKKILPSKIKSKIEAPKTKKNPLNFKQLITSKFQDTKKYLDNKKAQTTAKINTVKVFAAKKAIAVKTFDIKKVDAKKVSLVGSALLTGYVSRFFKYLNALDPKTLVISTSTFMAFTLTSISVYKQVSDIDEKTAKEVVRAPSSYADEMSKDALARSPYRNQDQMFINIPEIDVPIYIENGQGMQVLTVDFSFKASNRYISKYFEKHENEFVLRDRLNERLQPITVTFPLEKEGKNILRVKIKNELNALIKEMGMSGEIEEVYIHSILRP